MRDISVGVVHAGRVVVVRDAVSRPRRHHETRHQPLESAARAEVHHHHLESYKSNILRDLELV